MNELSKWENYLFGLEVKVQQTKAQLEAMEKEVKETIKIVEQLKKEPNE